MFPDDLPDDEAFEDLPDERLEDLLFDFTEVPVLLEDEDEDLTLEFLVLELLVLFVLLRVVDLPDEEEELPLDCRVVFVVALLFEVLVLVLEGFVVALVFL